MATSIDQRFDADQMRTEYRARCSGCAWQGPWSLSEHAALSTYHQHVTAAHPRPS